MGAGGGTEAHRVQWPNIRLRQARTREHPAALRWISASFARFFGAKRLNHLAPPRGSAAFFRPYRLTDPREPRDLALYQSTSAGEAFHAGSRRISTTLYAGVDLCGFERESSSPLGCGQGPV